MAWHSEYCYEPRLSRRHRAKYVPLDPERFVVRKKGPAPHLSYVVWLETVTNGVEVRYIGIKPDIVLVRCHGVTMTGIRSCISATRELGVVVRIVQLSMISPSGLLH